MTSAHIWSNPFDVDFVSVLLPARLKMLSFEESRFGRHQTIIADSDTYYFTRKSYDPC